MPVSVMYYQIYMDEKMVEKLYSILDYIESNLCHLILIFAIVVFLILDDIDLILHGNKIM